MDITPSKIRSQSFAQRLKDLEREDIEAVLGTVAAQMEQLAEERDQLESRLEWAKGKLQNVKYVYEKLKRREETLDERRRNLKEEKQALHQRREEVEQERQAVDVEKEKLMRVIARLQDTLEEELDILTELRSGRSSMFDPEGSGRSTPASTDSSSADSDGEEKEKSTQELVNSLFPNRLAPGGAGSDETESEEASEDSDDEKGAAAQQFDKIKQDIQGEQSASEPSTGAQTTAENDHSGSGPSEEDEEVDTRELDRIMGVFEDLDS